MFSSSQAFLRLFSERLRLQNGFAQHAGGGRPVSSVFEPIASPNHRREWHDLSTPADSGNLPGCAERQLSSTALRPHNNLSGVQLEYQLQFRRSELDRTLVSNCCISGFVYVGCYKDVDTDRDLAVLKSDLQDMTPNQCNTECNGYDYFAIQISRCWCGVSYGKHGVAQSQYSGKKNADNLDYEPGEHPPHLQSR